MAAADLGAAEWERSKITNQDLNLLKKLGISKKPKAVCFPSEESYPTPPMGYRVSFVDHLIRGLSAPIHPFLRGLLFVYGLQLHHLTPNSILHISIFITLCEAFLGVQPNWALWKRIFFCRRNGSSNVAYNIGGVVISVRSSVNYFDVKLPDSVQGWRKKWLYIREENHGCAEDNIPPFDGAEKILRRRSWDAEATEEERTSTEALMTRIHELQNTYGKELSGIHFTAYFLRTRCSLFRLAKTLSGLNPSNEIFSELDETNAQVPIFPRSFQNTGERGGLVGPDDMVARPGPGRATLWSRRLVDPPAPPLRLFKAPASKTLTEEATIREKFQSRRHREAKIWGTGVSVPAPCRRREVPPEGFSIDTAAISTAIFITAAAPMRRE
ncbi:hypothetical protein QYE76_023454 [Lolium multiflorum]|uniref:Transposase (putative) gypsy type domain-containing protein n=1 Tax=Lolium multiflorum TaxID=4521 RepID=A0AAD8RCW9_LOLMU|nr:hypothetical protein QYE76_023454 [Lolium multiflorum]